MSGRSDDGPVRPRVVMLAYQISPRDARYLKLHASFLAAGFDVAAAAPGLAGRASAPGVAEASADARPEGRVAAWLWARQLNRRLADIGAAFRPDVIYVFDPEALPAALEIKRRTHSSLIYDAHEFHEEEDPSAPARGAWVRRTELKAASALDGFITVNRSIAALYAAERPGLPAPLVVHNAVVLAPQPADDGRLRAAAGLARDARILLYQGGVAPMRGLDRLVQAAVRLSETWRLVIMGDGPLLPALRNLADPDRVRFIPPAPHAELAAWTRGAALGAILYEDTGRSQHFCSPNKLWEYAAAGVPALASDLPEIARVVGDNKTGVLLQSNASPAEIADVVNSLTDAALAEATAGAISFSRRENWDSEIGGLIALIGDLAGKAARFS